MKTHFTYCILLFAIVLTAGCRPELAYYDITPIVRADVKKLSGKWNYTSDDVKIYKNGQQTGGQPYTYNKGEYVQFNENGTGNDYRTSFTYTVKDDQLIINYSAFIEGGVPVDASTATFTVKELSANKLTLYYDASFKDSKNLLGGNIVMEYLSR